MNGTNLTLSERIGYMEYVIGMLQNTTSLNVKRDIINDIADEYRDDFEYILEILSGKHKLGYTYYRISADDNDIPIVKKWLTIKQYIQPLFEPVNNKDLSYENIRNAIDQVKWFSYFIEPIVNRTLRLGIGKSVLPKDGLSAMLAKNADNGIKQDRDGYFVTEKLDGNRCIARFDGIEWKFTSRNGKTMYVDIDMTGLPKYYVYDGELLSVNQTANSIAMTERYINNDEPVKLYNNEFNSTSGMINRHSKDKRLIYNIFDIMYDDASYGSRRDELKFICNTSDLSLDVRILPTLKHYKTLDELMDNLYTDLDFVTECGAEGLMINLASGSYLHKRTDQLLKVKKVKTVDLKVVDIEDGTGKYEYLVGSLYCEGVSETGELIKCYVGSGLSDDQRLAWMLHPEQIIGKIVEIAYFSLSQNKNSTGEYSLRFPRFKQIRNDKTEVSVY
jgi:DNA ligase-1